MYLTFSKEIKNIPFINSLLGEEVILYSHDINPSQIRGVIGWGLKNTARKAREFSQKNNIPYVSLEDGFICSYGLRINGYPLLSIIVDPLGIYYDATRPSLLEKLLSECSFSSKELSEAERALKLVIQHNISKYNYQPEADSSILKGKRNKKILVVDQTFNDMAVIYGLATRETFFEMFYAALKENPGADIYVKVHPDVLSKKKRGYLSEEIKERDNVFLITQDVNPLSLLKFFDKVYTVSSQMGFEALLLGKPVVCFGVPFYSGWGLTEDRFKIPRRKRKVELIELFYVSYLLYCKYINPVDGKIGTIFDVINFILKQREMIEKISKKNYYCIDFHLARRKFIKPFLQTEKNRVYFIKSKDLNKINVSRDSVLIVWGNKKREHLKGLNKKLPIWSIEDGFIRSVGLGAEFIPPMSIVIDKKGIYYNSLEESDLESILNEYEFTDEDLERAERIRKIIIKNNITKYNIEKIEKIKKPSEKKIILIPGQVEDDEAVILNGGSIKSNLELTEIVRSRNPESYIIYKPHPDVVSKNRKGDKGFKKIIELADHIETEHSILNCIEIADEIHTINSLAGFDALLREKKVFTYGGAFYAGWGLTEDELIFPKRKRKLTLNELTAGVLLIYPIYYDWKVKGFVDCETIINRIIYEREYFVNFSVKNNLPRFLKKLVNYFNFLRRFMLA